MLLTDINTVKIPKLRFKNFEGEWKIKKLSEVATFRRGSFPQPYGLSKWYDDSGGSPFVQVYDVGSNMRLKENTKRHISKSAEELSVFAPRGTLVLTIQGSIGRIAITQYDAYVDRTLLIFQSYKMPLDQVYFMFVVSLLFEREKDRAPGGTIKTITKERLSSFPVMMPSLKEQKKIAHFLMAVERKCIIMQQKVDQLQSYKNGIMQSLFAQKNRFEFKTNQGPSSWQKKAIMDIAYSETSPLSANSITERSGSYKVYGASGVLQTLDSYHYEDEYIAIVKDGSGAGRIMLCEPKSSVLGTLIVVQPKEGTDKIFLYYLLSLIDFKKYVTGSTIPHVYFSQYSASKFSIPVLEEQRQIANFLKSIDDRIRIEQSKLDQARLFKKALLQQMFV